MPSAGDVLALRDKGRMRSHSSSVSIWKTETRMAEIIRIKDRLSLSDRRVRRDGMAAEVLLFTGIRYERYEQQRKKDNRLPALPRPVDGGMDQRP